MPIHKYRRHKQRQEQSLSKCSLCDVASDAINNVSVGFTMSLTKMLLHNRS